MNNYDNDGNGDERLKFAKAREAEAIEAESRVGTAILFNALGDWSAADAVTIGLSINCGRRGSMDDGSNDVKRQLDEAYSLASDRKDYNGALSACDAIGQAHPELMAPFRKKAQIYAHKADFKQAIDEISSVIEKGPIEPGDYFFRGWWKLEDSNASDALEDLSKAIELGKQLGDDYFMESALSSALL